MTISGDRANIAKYCHRNPHDHLNCDHDLNGNRYGITTTLSVSKNNKTVTANVITAGAVTKLVSVLY